MFCPPEQMMGKNGYVHVSVIGHGSGIVTDTVKEVYRLCAKNAENERSITAPVCAEHFACDERGKSFFSRSPVT